MSTMNIAPCPVTTQPPRRTPPYRISRLSNHVDEAFAADRPEAPPLVVVFAQKVPPPQSKSHRRRRRVFARRRRRSRVFARRRSRLLPFFRPPSTAIAAGPHGLQQRPLRAPETVRIVVRATALAVAPVHGVYGVAYDRPRETRTDGQPDRVVAGALHRPNERGTTACGAWPRINRRELNITAGITAVRRRSADGALACRWKNPPSIPVTIRCR